MIRHLLFVLFFERLDQDMSMCRVDSYIKPYKEWKW